MVGEHLSDSINQDRIPAFGFAGYGGFPGCSGRHFGQAPKINYGAWKRRWRGTK